MLEPAKKFSANAKVGAPAAPRFFKLFSFTVPNKKIVTILM